MAEKARDVSVKVHKWLTEEMGYQGAQRQGKSRESQKERKERAELLAKEKKLQRSLQETDAALLRSHHEIEKLHTELSAIAQAKRKLRESYDENRQRLLLLQGAERQMKLDVAVFSEYTQRMLAITRFEQQKRQRFDGPQLLTSNAQIAPAVRDSVAALCAKVRSESVTDVHTQTPWPSEHVEDILRALLQLCNAHIEKLKEKERQEAALSGGEPIGVSSKVSQLLFKLREEHSRLFLATEDNLNKADALNRTRASTGSDSSRPQPLLQQLFVKEQELAAALAASDVVSRYVKQLAVRRHEAGTAKQKLSEKREELKRWDEANAQKRHSVQALVQQNTTLRSRFASQEGELMEFLQGSTSASIASLDSQLKSVALLAQGDVRRFTDVKLSTLRTLGTLVGTQHAACEHKLWAGTVTERLRDPQGLLARICATIGMQRQGSISALMLAVRELKSREFAMSIETAFARTLLHGIAPTVQRLTAPLLIQDITSEVQRQDEEINTQLVPSLEARTQSIKAAMAECTDVAKLLDEWFNQPAQFTLPNVVLDGHNVEQVLGRYRASVA